MPSCKSRVHRQIDRHALVVTEILNITVLQRILQVSVSIKVINPLDPKGNYSAISNSTKLVHWPLMGGMLHLVPSTASVPVGLTAHPSTASVRIAVWSVALRF